jgi:transcriptional regulator with XRE-family HTH domain
MTARNMLTMAPPYAVERSLKRLGADLRTARLRRNLTIEDVAGKIGTGRRAVSDAEKGKPSTGAAVYIALLWVYDLLGPFDALADPATDTAGLAQSDVRQRARGRDTRDLDNDF